MALPPSQDRAIETEIDDRLNRIPFVDNLIKALVIEERDLTGKVIARHSAGVVVGLTGKWGSGKSSILNLLAERLGKFEYVAVAMFNPWLFKGRDELLTAFFNELRDALGKNAAEPGRGLVEALDRYQWAIEWSGTVPGRPPSICMAAAGRRRSRWRKRRLNSLEKWRGKKLQAVSPQAERRGARGEARREEIGGRCSDR